MPIDDGDWLVERFEVHRSHLRAVAYRILGSTDEAEDAVQDAWVRVSRAGGDEIENLRAWLTTIVARVCLNVLQARKSRPETSSRVRLPEPIVSRVGEADPEQAVLMADSVGLALQVVLDTLSPAERLAFVLHDMFGVSFDEIGPMVDRSPAAARQLASRARRRVRGATAPVRTRDLAGERRLVEAFFSSAHRGDFDALVAVLDPNVVLRSDGGEQRRELTFVRRGAAEVARAAITSARPDAVRLPVLVNGVFGVAVMAGSRLLAVMGFAAAGSRICEISCFRDPEYLARLDVMARPVERPAI